MSFESDQLCQASKRRWVTPSKKYDQNTQASSVTVVKILRDPGAKHAAYLHTVDEVFHKTAEQCSIALAVPGYLAEASCLYYGVRHGNRRNRASGDSYRLPSCGSSMLPSASAVLVFQGGF